MSSQVIESCNSSNFDSGRVCTWAKEGTDEDSFIGNGSAYAAFTLRKRECVLDCLFPPDMSSCACVGYGSPDIISFCELVDNLTQINVFCYENEHNDTTPAVLAALEYMNRVAVFELKSEIS